MALSHSKNLGFNLQQIKTLLKILEEVGDLAAIQDQINDLEARIEALENV